MNKPPKVIPSPVLGFCGGVRRAMDMAYKALEDYPGQPIYTHGPLIHNPAALSALERRGIRVLDAPINGRPRDLTGASVIIRAHGVGPKEVAELETAGARVLDATCPRVRSAQRTAAEYAARGFGVIIAGDPGHAEVTGLVGWATQQGTEAASAGHVVVVRNRGEAARAPLPGPSWVLLGQSTINPAEYAAIAETLRARLPSLVVKDTLCPEVGKREEAVRALGAALNGRGGILVVGGRNSANTARLYEIARSVAADAVLVETAEEVPPRFFAMETVGISAGASTPDEMIEAVAARLGRGASNATRNSPPSPR
jgi:4-hydroxy-3-methylbut-2-enyl diphosphate reductase